MIRLDLTILLFLSFQWSRSVFAAPSSLYGTSNSSNECIVDAQNATAFALTYSYPLTQFQRIVLNTTINSVVRQATASPNSSVVRPNADTEYALTVYDLSAQDLNITVPEVDSGRYWDFAFYAPYGENFLNIGSVNNSSPGTYLLRYSGEKSGLTSCDGYTGCVDSVTSYGVILARLAYRNTTSDLAIVGALLNNITVEQVPRTNVVAPPLSSFGLPFSEGASSVMQLTAALAPWNLPSVLSDRTTVNCTLENAGIDGSQGTYEQPDGVDLELAQTQSNASWIAALSSPEVVDDLRNDWSIFSPDIIGIYGSNYEVRAFAANALYLALTSDQALYPAYELFEGSLGLASGEAYLVTFSGKPEVNAFWSLTVYDAEGQLIANDLGSFALGDRSNITYPDGSPVYGSDTGVDNGSFQLLLQAQDVSPPTNWTSNWLPTQAGGGNFSLNLRFYAPSSSLMNGTYEYPVIAKTSAITA